MKSGLRTLALLAAIFLSVSGMFAQAHEGHDHDKPPPLNLPVAPRVIAVTPELELVGVLSGKDHLTIFLHEFASNKPIAGARMAGQEPTSKDGRVILFGGWRLDTLRRELRNPDGVIIDLSVGEYDLLLTFLEAPQRVLDRDYLIEVTRRKSLSAFDRSIDVQISRLRRKIEGGDDDESIIKTVRGAGYMLTSTVSRK